jgi:hypothetical protein
VSVARRDDESTERRERHGEAAGLRWRHYDAAQTRERLQRVQHATLDGNRGV